MNKIPTEWKVMESHNPFHGSSHHQPGLIPMKSPFSYGFPMFQTCPNQADQSATAKRHGICLNFASRDPPSGTTGHVTGTDEKLEVPIPTIYFGPFIILGLPSGYLT